MSYQLNTHDLSEATIQIPHLGIWIAEVSPIEAPALTVGSAATLTISDLTLVGTIRSGGTFVSRSTYFIVGGRDGWRKPVKPRSYRGDNGIKLSSVAADLALDTGEQLVLEAGAERVLGPGWTRFAGVASEALDALGTPWWVAADGVTHVGARPASTVSTKVKIAVQAYDPSVGSVSLTTPDDTIAAFVPGASFTADEIPSFKIATTKIRVRTGTVSLEMWS